MNAVLEAAWNKAVGGLDWLKQVVFGEFEDHRDLSAVIADMLVSFVPGVVIVTSARDLTAVILRLARYPARRERTEEWMLLIACAIPLVLPILAAAAGAVAAGVGAVIGGIAGSEAGAVLRAVCLLLISKGSHALVEVVGFLRRFVKGDILKVLRDIQFAKYSQPIVHYIGEFIGRLIGVLQRLRAELLKVDAFHWLADVLKKLEALEREFYAVQSSAVKAIPKALAELDIRLQQVLSEALPHNPRPALAGVPAGTPTPVPARPERVPAMPGNPLGRPEGTTAPQRPPSARPEPNHHPENPHEPGHGNQPPTRTLDELVPGGKIPSVKNGEFNRWFSQLSPEEFDRIWAVPAYRDTIQARIRQPGGLHEWLPVAKTDKFKSWGVSMEDIKSMRTPIGDVRGSNPAWSHGGTGSTTAHNEMLELVDSSSSFADYKARLQAWADSRLVGGRSALPEGLRN